MKVKWVHKPEQYKNSMCISQDKFAPSPRSRYRRDTSFEASELLSFRESVPLSAISLSCPDRNLVRRIAAGQDLVRRLAFGILLFVLKHKRRNADECLHRAIRAAHRAINTGVPGHDIRLREWNKPARQWNAIIQQ